jgi:hypothetical protein
MINNKELDSALDADLIKEEEEIDLFDADLRATNEEARKKAEETTIEDIEDKLETKQFRRMLEVNAMIINLIF